MDNTGASVVGAIIGVLVYLIIIAGVYVWLSLALGAMFKKAGEPAWAGWVPVYNVMVIAKMGGLPPLLGLASLAGFGSVVIAVSSLKINQNFRQPSWYLALALFATPVWASILGWGAAQWAGPAGSLGSAPAAGVGASAAPTVSNEVDDLFGMQPAHRDPAWAQPADTGRFAAPLAPAAVDQWAPQQGAARGGWPAGSDASLTDSWIPVAPAAARTADAWSPTSQNTTPAADAWNPTPAAAAAADVWNPTPVTSPPAASAPAPDRWAPTPTPPAPAPAPADDAWSPAPATAPTPADAWNPTPTPAAGSWAQPPQPAAASAWEPAADPAGSAPWGQPAAPAAPAPEVWAPAPAQPAPDVWTPATSAPAPAPDAWIPAPAQPASGVWNAAPAANSWSPAAAPAPASATPAARAWDAVPEAAAADSWSNAAAAPEAPSVAAPAWPASDAAAADRGTRASEVRMREDAEVVAQARAAMNVPAAEPSPVADDGPVSPIVVPGPSGVMPGVTPPAPAVAGAPAADAWQPATHREPQLADPAFDMSAEVSAVAGAPDAGAPRSAMSSISAQHANAGVPDEAEHFEATEIAVRHRPTWTLVTPVGSEILLTSNIVILGRKPSSERADGGAQLVPVPDGTRTVSKTHARLEQRDGTWFVTDLGSTNGVVLIGPGGEEREAAPHVPVAITERFLLGDAELRIASSAQP